MSDEESDNEPEVEVDDEDEEAPIVSKSATSASKKIIQTAINSDADEDDDDEDEDDFDEDLIEQLEPDEDELDQTIGAIDPSKVNDGEISPINSDVESDDEEFLQKIDVENRNEYVEKFHPECLTGNSDEIEVLTKVKRDALNNIIDPLHKTNPFLSKYEKTRVLGQRAKQLNLGHPPLVDVPSNIIDGYLIAKLELAAKKIPVIIRRPLPGGTSEYWKLQDLELI